MKRILERSYYSDINKKNLWCSSFRMLTKCELACRVMMTEQSVPHCCGVPASKDHWLSGETNALLNQLNAQRAQWSLTKIVLGQTLHFEWSKLIYHFVLFNSEMISYYFYLVFHIQTCYSYILPYAKMIYTMIISLIIFPSDKEQTIVYVSFSVFRVQYSLYTPSLSWAIF